MAWRALQALPASDLKPLGDEKSRAELHQRIAAAFSRFDRHPAVAYRARYEQARHELRAGDRSSAWRTFAELYQDAAKRVVLPPVDADFFAAMASFPHSTRRLESLLTGSADRLAKAGLHRASIALAGRLRAQGDRLPKKTKAERRVRKAVLAVSDRVLRDAVKNAPPRQRYVVSLDAVSLLWSTGRYDWAEKVIAPMLENEKYARSPWLWRIASQIAERREQHGSSADRWQRALDLEFAKLGEKVELKKIRADYGALLPRYQQVAEAVGTDRDAGHAALQARIIAAADRWRGLDTDPTAACQAAAKALAKIGAKQLAWDYLTTPLADRPNEAAPWVSLAESMREQGEIELADRAYASAFAAEGTNAQILWDRAEMLRGAGRVKQARALRKQIAEGEWPRQFLSLKQQARAMVARGKE